MTSLFPLGRSTLWLGALSLVTSACLLIDPVEAPGETTISNGGSSGGGDAGVGGDAGIGGDAGTGGTGGSSGCRSNLECYERPGSGEVPQRCRADGQCVKLQTPECPVVLTAGRKPHYNAPNALFIGAFAQNPSAAASNPADSVVIWNYQLALDELSGETRDGLPDPETSATTPVVVVVCNNSAVGAADRIEQGVDHLVNEVQVPAIVAALLPNDMFNALEVGVPENVFFMSPQGATSSVAGYPDEDLAWHMLGQPSEMAPVYAEVLEQAETWLTQVAEPRRFAPLRVATVSSEDAFDIDLQNATLAALVFNGKSAPVNQNEGNLASFVVTTSNRAAQVEAILQYRPHVIISFTGLAFTNTPGIMTDIESNWNSPAYPDAPLPFYILSPINQSDPVNLEAIVEAGQAVLDTGTHERVVGVSVAPPADRTLYNQYLFRLRAAHANAPAETENYYDAMAYLLYSMYGGGTFSEINGQSVATGMFRLIRGSERHDIGPDGRLGVLSALETPSKNIRLFGTLGAPRFDTSGVRVDEASVFCFDGSANLVNHALRYDRTTGTLLESVPCAFYTP